MFSAVSANAASLAFPLACLFVVAIFMIIEARRAAMNERAQRSRGGIEPSDDVYQLMQIAYPGIFIAMLAEGALRGVVVTGVWFASGLTIFVAAKILKWWAISALGPLWTFRVIVVPGSPSVATGPYRIMRHPNYVAVVGEIVSVALMMRAVITGPLALLVFGMLLVRRIAVENRVRDAILRRG
jgi:methyltransferase